MLSDLERGRFTALDKLVPHRWTDFSIPWAPVGAKKGVHITVLCVLKVVSSYKF